MKWLIRLKVLTKKWLKLEMDLKNDMKWIHIQRTESVDYTRTSQSQLYCYFPDCLSTADSS